MVSPGQRLVGPEGRPCRTERAASCLSRTSSPAAVSKVAANRSTRRPSRRTPRLGSTTTRVISRRSHGSRTIEIAHVHRFMRWGRPKRPCAGRRGSGAGASGAPSHGGRPVDRHPAARDEDVMATRDRGKRSAGDRRRLLRARPRLGEGGGHEAHRSRLSRRQALNSLRDRPFVIAVIVAARTRRSLARISRVVSRSPSEQPPTAVENASRGIRRARGGGSRSRCCSFGGGAGGSGRRAGADQCQAGVEGDSADSPRCPPPTQFVAGSSLSC